MRAGPLKIKVQLLCGDSFAMGPGKADLLEAIGREGSISAAGRVMGMSYRKTWVLVDEMNRCFESKLVETLAGGGRERGARITPAGQRVLAAYRLIEAEAMKLGASEGSDILADLVLDAPRAARPPLEPEA